MDPLEEVMTEETAKRAFLRDIAGTIKNEIERTKTDFRPTNRNGTIESSIDALHEVQAQAPLPEFLPTFGLPLPEPIAMMRRDMRVSTRMGLFPEISRAWIIVDNKVVLWNYSVGSEFTSYSEEREPIVNVALVKPNRDVFQTYIVYLLVVMTPTAITLLGITFTQLSDIQRSPLEIVALGYSVATQAPITIVRQQASTRRLFATGVDGKLYELEYYKTHLVLRPKIRLVDHTIYFGATPVLSAVGSAIANAKQTWTKPREPAIDLSVDERWAFILFESGCIEAWAFETSPGTKGKHLVRKAESQHTVAALQAGLLSNAPQQLSPLQQLFCTGEDRRIVVATAANGDRYYYEYRHHGFSFASTSELAVVERQPILVGSTLLANTQVSVAYLGHVGSSIHVTAHVSKADPSAPDLAAITVAPRVVLPPHNNIRDVTTVVQPALQKDSSGVVYRIEAIGEVAQLVDDQGRQPLCSQVICPPEQLMLLHRHGISFHIRLRPVDTLHLILDASDDLRDNLLHRFHSAYGYTDFCAMLVQIACGNLGQGDLLVDERTAGSPLGVMRRLSYSAASSKHTDITPEDLGRMLLSPVKQRTIRAAMELLASSSAAAVAESNQIMGSSIRSISIQMSPMLTGLTAYVARALSTVWEVQLFEGTALALEGSAIERTDTLLVEVQRLLGRLKDHWGGYRYPRNARLTWENNRCVLRYPASEHINPQREAEVIQFSRLTALHDTVEIALQILVFLQKLRREVPTSVLTTALKTGGATLTSLRFMDLVMRQDDSGRLAKAVVGALVAAEEGVAVPQYQHLINFFSNMEQECKYLFNAVDAVEFRARVDLSNMSRLGGLSEKQLTELVAKMSPNAAALWRSGSLEPLCAQIVALKQEELAVPLLLRAAAQLDVSQSSVQAYFENAYATRHMLSAASYDAQPREVFQAKCTVVSKVTAILDHLCASNRPVFDRLLGVPFKVHGTIWTFEKADLITHCLLFDWLLSKSGDDATAGYFRALLVSANSVAVEGYLIGHESSLGRELALYLHRRKFDPTRAIHVYSKLGASQYLDVPLPQRLDYRISCLREAMNCAGEAHVDASTIRHALTTLETQKDLVSVIERAQANTRPSDALITIDGVAAKPTEHMDTHLSYLRAKVLDPQTIARIANFYRGDGGADVVLSILAQNGYPEDLFCEVLPFAFQHPRGNLEPRSMELARDLLHRFYHPTGFPLPFAIQLFEASIYPQLPAGSDAVPQVLVSVNIGLDTAVEAYRRIYDDLIGQTVCEAFADAQVSKPYLMHSMASLLLLNLQKRAGKVNPATFRRVHSYIRTIRDNVDLQRPEGVASSAKDAEGIALERTTRILLSCEAAISQSVQQGDRSRLF